MDTLFDLTPSTTPRPTPRNSPRPGNRPRPTRPTGSPPLSLSCSYCRTAPATVRLGTAPNLLTEHDRAGYPLAPYTTACCDPCSSYLASVYWDGISACPTGRCSLWAHTLADPLPGLDCTRHHRELTVVWRERLVTG